jgi:hypothetical protein
VGFTLVEFEDLHDVIEIATQKEIATPSSAATQTERVVGAETILFTESFPELLVR